jgi:hypothetical protein
MNKLHNLTDEEVFLGRIYTFIRRRAAYVRQREAGAKTPGVKPENVNTVDKDPGRQMKKNSSSRDRLTC